MKISSMLSGYGVSEYQNASCQCKEILNIIVEDGDIIVKLDTR